MNRVGEIKSASFDVRRRAKQTRAFERGDHVLVVPNDKSKQMRCVSFMPNGQVLCQAYESGEICEANSYQNVCYHSAAAWKRKETNRKRRETLRAKKQGIKAA